MQIEMIRDFRVAEDGSTVVLWTAGSIHDTYDQLAGDLIGAGVARAVADHQPQDQADLPEIQVKRRGRPPRDNK